MRQSPRETPGTGRPPEDIPVSTVHPELRYELAEDLDDAATDAGPTYRRVPGGETVVPTGRVLVRFPEGDAATEHQDDLESVGVVVDQVLPYAPNAAWVRAATGDVADGLHALDRLVELPGVVAVEPEMIGTRSTRG